MAFEFKSSAFGANQQIPVRYTCDGEQMSPPLMWSEAPQNTATFALIVDDPDAPSGIFTHWVLFNIPSNVDHLDENLPRVQPLGHGMIQGSNDFGRPGYGAPCPPPGSSPHHYRFTLYALDAALPLQADATRQQLMGAMQRHVLDQAQLVATYARQSPVLS